MNSYTIDPSVFSPPPIPNNNNERKKFPDEITRYCKTINKCYNLILNNQISIYVFHFSQNKFDNDYKKIAVKNSILPIDMYKKQLDNIVLYNIPSHHYGSKINAKKYYFEDWLEECLKIKYPKYEQSTFNPSFQLSIKEKKEFTKRLNLIGIINNFIYKNSTFHILIVKESIERFLLDSKNVTFSLNEKTSNEELMTAKIDTKHIDHLKYHNEEKYKSVLEAYNNAKIQFSRYIIFGNDVEKGIKTIRNSAGPPDRIFAYLKTLTEYCEYKMNNGNIIPDDIILNALGCICSYESENDMKDKKVKNDRMFDNGKNRKKLFNLHLKPNTFSELDDLGNKSRTVRIYISWDDKQKKVIVGWIGKHLYLPHKKLLAFPQSSHYNKIGEPK
jgi:hypothetical protein